MDNKFKEYCNNISSIINAIVKFLIVFIILILFVILLNYFTDNTEKVIDKEINKIETKNDSIKQTVNYLDSIKYEKSNQVQFLDNDSTIKLFYKLIKSNN